MSIDLSVSAVSDDGMALILLRVQVKDLIKICPQVSPQWNRILSDNFFWRKKMEHDGYKLESPKLAGLSTKSFKTMALKHCFGRNLIKDCWDLDPNIDQNLTLDPRWETDRIWQWEEEHLVDDSFKAMIEIPPAFIEGDQDIQPKFDTSIEACISIDTETFGKDIIIKLADEGLTDDIMDNFRPTIVVSEMVGKRLDGDIIYTMRCSLDASIDDEDDHFPKHPIPNEDQYGVFRNESRDENGRWVDVTIDLQLGRYQGEGWHRVQHVFKDYPTGMRYLTLNCKGVDFYGSPYGLKLANCSVMALCEKNAEMKGI